jgi:hypothetical protein
MSDAKGDFARLRLDRDGHHAAGGRFLDPGLHQRGQRADHRAPVRVGAQGRGPHALGRAFGRADQRDLPLSRDRAHARHHAARQIQQPHAGVQGQRGAALLHPLHPLHPREVQQIGGHPLQLARGVEDLAEEPLALVLVGADVLVQHDLREA